MHVAIVILLTAITSAVKVDRQPLFVKPPAESNDDASQKNFFILTEDGLRYLIQKSLKTVPGANPELNSRVSRRYDPSDSRFVKDPKQEPSRRVGDITLKQTSFPIPQRALRRNDKSSRPEVTNVQRIKSPDGIIAVPVSVSPKGKPNSKVQLNNNGIQLNNRADESKISDDIQGKRNNVLTANLVNSLSPETLTFGKDITGSVFSLKSRLSIPEDTSNPEPYDFGYKIEDGLGSSQFRSESTNGDGVIIGNYGYKDYQGVFRHVNYVADKDGFRAVMRSNEPSVVPVDSADVRVIVDPPPPFFITSS